MKPVSAKKLSQLVERLFLKEGTEAHIASAVTQTLVEGDLLGHFTHGTKLACGYLKDIRSGHARTEDAALEVIQQSPVATQYDAHYLLGPYAVLHALRQCAVSAKASGIGIANIRRSHHIACLAAYLEEFTEQGLMPIVYTSDPATASVAPFGGKARLYTPNPLAIGIPTSGKPILIDISMSEITNGQVNKSHSMGERLPQPSLLDDQGNASDDPSLFFSSGASILPLGGLGFGHKGFALGIMVEALTSALGGFGRKDSPEGWGASVCVMVIDPARFGGIDAFKAEMDHFVAASLNSGKRVPGQPVRLPGHRGLQLKKQALSDGIFLPADVIASLEQAVADAGGVPLDIYLD
ncbi:Ldh family oxidoreductase [Pokkaliibacter sp. CJK22405]|uniref:Ldh family oxidoreductase n=1 Tax=Pokkaliibacter sp. CJK22405 TaxID=3384615 RepID=UPI0039847C74